ncbi:enoyl-CoA hydratase/isomerase family protein [Hyphococcus sp.]|uniref:enoyl-CoA hydratase/isomerase family protein n=1 Tax=Hyphococcus sp. TaxID=2038636 RepID=UPI003CCBB567
MTANGQNRAIEVVKREGVGWVILNRPDSINAINDDIRSFAPMALKTLDEDREIRVIAIRGAGERGFCVGADLKETRSNSSAQASRTKDLSWIESISSLKKPIVAVIHGFCIGGGLEIALACDLRIASGNAVFSLPETGLGVIPGGGGTQRLPRLIGQGRASDMILSGEKLSAGTAFQCGLINRLFTDDNAFFADAEAYLQQVAQRPPLALQAAKKAINQGLMLELEEGLRLERVLFSGLLSTEDRKEALAAFREKRDATFAGA